MALLAAVTAATDSESRETVAITETGGARLGTKSGPSEAAQAKVPFWVGLAFGLIPITTAVRTSNTREGFWPPLA